MNVHTATFFSAMLTMTKSVGLFASAQQLKNGNVCISITTAKNPVQLHVRKKTFACPYTAAGFVLKIIAATVNHVPEHDVQPTLMLTNTNSNVAQTVENAVLFASSACNVTLTAKKLAPLSFLIGEHNQAFAYVEMHHHQFVIASISGEQHPIVVGYAPEETVDEETYKWALNSVSNWTECQLCATLTIMITEVRPSPKPGLLAQLSHMLTT